MAKERKHGEQIDNELLKECDSDLRANLLVNGKCICEFKKGKNGVYNT